MGSQIILANNVVTNSFPNITTVPVGHARQPRGLRAAEPAAVLQRLSLNPGRPRADRASVDFALGLFAFWPALAIGSFLNVVAARVPLRRSVVQPGVGVHELRHRARVVRQRPGRSRTLLLRGRCRTCGARIRAVYPARRARRPALLVAGCFLDVRPHAARPSSRRSSASRSSRSRATDLEHRIVPNRIVAAGRGDRARWRRRRSHPSPEWAIGGARRLRLPVRRRARLPGRDGHGRREARAAARRDARPARRRSALMLGMLAALVPARRPPRPPRLGRAQDGRSRSRRSSRSGASGRALRRAHALLDAYLSHLLSAQLSSPVLPIPRSRDRMDLERPQQAQAVRQAPALRRPPTAGDAGAAPRRYGVNEVAELVADLIEATGLVPADRLALVARPRRAGRLARRRRSSTRASPRARASRARSPAATSCRSSTSPLTGVDAEAAERDPARTCSSASARSRTRSRATRSAIAIADPENVHGDRRAAARDAPPARARASRRATTSSTEIRRLARASEALGARAASTRTTVARRERGRGRRPRGRRRHLRRPARPARQLDHLPGGRGRRQRHPLRAAGGRARRPPPHRRRAARGAAHPEAADAPA